MITVQIPSLSPKMKQELARVESLIFKIQCSPSSRNSTTALRSMLVRNGIESELVKQTFFIPRDRDRDEYASEVIGKLRDAFTQVSNLSVFTLGHRTLGLFSEDTLVGYCQHTSLASLISMGVEIVLDRRIVQPLVAAMRDYLPEPLLPNVYRISLGDKDTLIKITEVLPTRSELTRPEALFPFVKSTPAELWQAFAASSSNVLLLIGPPGTGKSSFIYEMLQARGWDKETYIADRESVLLHDGLTDFVRRVPAGSVVVTEDSDKLVAKREDGNSSMAGLLNTTAGIIPTNTKIIISTNLPNLKRVDEALIRPGRTFAALGFRPLTLTEAHEARAALQLPAVDFDEKYTQLTLAEALNYGEIAEEHLDSGRIGF